MAETNYATFNDACEAIHDTVHGWVGGTMSNVGYAAFDPVFWAHHTMIDRLWWLWQQQGRMNAVPAPGWESIVLEPFNLTVGDVLDANALGLDYADSETLVERLSGAGRPGEVIVCEPVPCAVAVPVADFKSADFEIGGIRHTGSSYEGLVYINNPDAGPDTGRDRTPATRARLTCSATAAASAPRATATTARTSAGASTTGRSRARSA
jgi:hypothetical protein